MLDVFIIAIGLSMDSFAVSVCKGLAMKKLDMKKALIIGLYMGFFQGFMPVIGYYLGTAFSSLIASIDHWVAFILLGYIGSNMIREAFKSEEAMNDDVSFREMIVLAIATSIDALTVGVTFSFMDINIMTAFWLIGCTTFTLSVAAVALGHKLGSKLGSSAEILGGIILITMGIKILLEHLGIIA